MTDPTFTKERLREIVKQEWLGSNLAAFALAQMEEKEAAEAERDSLRLDKFRLGQERGEEWKRAENAEAERDRLARELFEAEDAIREADRIMSEAETREPIESIWRWRLLWSAKAWRLVQLAVRRARERAK